MKVSLAELLVAQVTKAIEDPRERASVTSDVVVCDLGGDYWSEAQKALNERAEKARGAEGARA